MHINVILMIIVSLQEQQKLVSGLKIKHGERVLHVDKMDQEDEHVEMELENDQNNVIWDQIMGPLYEGLHIVNLLHVE
jgi:hypothetical protein